MARRRYILYALGVAGFVCLVRMMRWQDAQEILRHLEAGWLGLALLLSLAVQACKIWRWRILLRIAGQRISLADAVYTWMIGVFWGTVTPARAGAFCSVACVRRLSANTAPAGRIVSLVLICQLLDMATIVGVGAAGIFFFPAGVVIRRIFFSVIVAGVFVMGLYWFSRGFQTRMRQALQRTELWHPFHLMVEQLRHVRQGLKGVTDPRMGQALVFHALAYGCFYLGIVCLACAFGMSLPVGYMCFAMSAAMLVSALPVSIAGLGSRDAVLLLMLRPMGIAYEQTLLFSMIYLIIFLIVPGLAGAVIYFWRTGFEASRDPGTARGLKTAWTGEERE